jgi:Xaa-Pro aminopeptidase
MTDAGSRAREFAGKLERLRSVMRAQGVAGAAFRSRRNFAWLTAGGHNHVAEASDEGVATILVTDAGAVVLTAVNEAPRIRDEEVQDLPIEVVGLPWECPEALGEAIRARVDGPVVDDAALEPELWPLRATLCAEERARFALLGAKTARAMTATLATARCGELETQVGARLALALAADGISGPVILVASDERILNYRHPIPKPKPVDTSLMLIVGAEMGGLIVAMTRFAWVRGRPDTETERRFDAVNRVHRAFFAATRAGRTLGEVLADGVAEYAAAGFPDEWPLHHQGGPIGYQGREAVATPTGSAVIAPDMAFAWNPSITGTKAEDTFVLRPDGSRDIVTRDPYWPARPDGEPGIWIASEWA